jgi:hypothetical protein
MSVMLRRNRVTTLGVYMACTGLGRIAHLDGLGNIKEKKKKLLYLRPLHPRAYAFGMCSLTILEP